ncbi:MAG: S8 family serine peptidase, partial [Actinomycetota bacterium]|nr:S8 family serine peptidase [Actinomycetota bacterium]
PAQRTTPANAQPPAAHSRVIPDHYIVQLRDSVANPRAVAQEHASRHAAAVSHVYTDALRGYAARIPSNRLAALRDDPRVLSISEDREVHAVAQSIPTGVARIQPRNSSGAIDSTRAWARIDGTDDRLDVDIAILDTGLWKSGHEDLRTAGGYNCMSSDRNAWNDGHGHGTHVAGSAAAIDNDKGVVGVAPGARLWAVKVLSNSGSGSSSTILCGIDYVTKRNNGTIAGGRIEVANMSLGGWRENFRDDGNCGRSTNFRDSVHAAICNSITSGTTYTAAAGNDNWAMEDEKWMFWPAAYNEVLAVTAIADFNGRAGGGASATCRSDVDDTTADFSDFAANPPVTGRTDDRAHTIAAPGVCIRSTYKGSSSSYATMSGTSMASPHAAGLAALYKVRNQGATPATIIGALRNGAYGQPDHPTYDYRYAPYRNGSNTSGYYHHMEIAGS